MNATSSILLIDAGNTRIKWAVYRLDDKVLQATQASDYRQPSWLDQIKQQVSQGCEKILMCSVAASAVAEQIATLSATAHIPCRQLKNGHMAQGLRETAYSDPSQLGADRCVLMIGGRVVQPQGNLCVVSCGTALTVDLLDHHGRHLGGLISASPRAIRQKMVQDAARIDIEIDLAPQLIKMDSFYTQSTEQALYNGSVLSAVGLISRVWAQLQSQARSEDVATAAQAAWHLLYSGGGIQELLPYLPEQGLYYPDLLMTGLAAIADN